MTLSAPPPKAENGGGTPPIMPQHVAIIMDGNGRWAAARNMPRSVGHERGVEALRRTVEASKELGLTHLTIFSFSTENWRRPISEVNALFGLLKMYVRQDLAKLRKEGVRIRVLGTRAGLPKDISDLVEQAERETENNSAFHLCIAFNYGGREEIIRAATEFAEDVKSGKRNPADLNEQGFEQYLDTAGLPDPDLLIRTSGELRISNFLLWQAAYAELVFLDVLWPDFRADHLSDAISTFQQRQRRFGGVSAETA